MSTRVTDRFEAWIDPEAKRRIQLAARLERESVGDFVRNAAEQRANEILLRHGVVTIVPVDVFDKVVSALEDKEQRAAEGARRRGPRTPVRRSVRTA
jgi:uncharacterized protein (DUF1778 family)